MDRFITREPRNDREYLQQHGNRMMPYPSNASNTQNNLMCSEMYHGSYGAEFPGSNSMQQGGGRFGSMNMSSMGGIGSTGGALQMNMPLYASTLMHPDQTQIVSGINQQYLAAYADNSATIIAGQQRMQNERSNHNPMTTTANYNYRSFSGPGGVKTFVPQMVTNPPQLHINPEWVDQEELNQHGKSLADTQKFMAREKNFNLIMMTNKQDVSQKAPQLHINPEWVDQEELNQHGKSLADTQKFMAREKNFNLTMMTNKQDVSKKVSAPVKQSNEGSFIKQEYENPVKTRFDKLKELHRSGPRAFSGPVEKVLKWHKSLQDLGLLIIYEVVAKCVSVHQGEWCSKNLVIRDDQGPAMQVVYYEIDFLLPELKPPCTIRVVGRMAAGTSRLHAFSVRAAAGDDVAALPRRAAVAAHHVAKLCSQYSSNAV